MSKKIKRIAGIIGFVLLFAFVVYTKTVRKLKRTGVIKSENTEQMQTIIKAKKDAQQKAYELARQKEQHKRDSVQEVQRQKLAAQRKKSQDILNSLKDK